jgi:hypothetical protein
MGIRKIKMEKKTFKIMKKRILLIASVLVLIGCGSDSEKYGFYQSSAYMEGFLLDKENGTIWVHTYFPGEGEGEWVNLGNPPTEAPNEGDRYKTEYEGWRQK